jgi:DNA-directed RNA polymerase
MPNLVHSLDACTLCLLFEKFSRVESNHSPRNFYSVHDCYGVTANNIESLIKDLQSIYIRLYTTEVYLQSFHKDLITFIQNVYRDYTYDEKTGILTVNSDKYSLPSPPKADDAILITTKDSLSNSLYAAN